MKPPNKVIAALLATAFTIVLPFTCGHEGNKLKAYPDIGKVWTVCGGVAHVAPGTTYTATQCDQITKDRIEETLHQVYDLTGPLPVQVLAADSDFTYNLGIGVFRDSDVLWLQRHGQLADSCEAILNYPDAGGRDCRIRANNCYGVWQRRLDESSLCLQGVNQQPEKP